MSMLTEIHPEVVDLMWKILEGVGRKRSLILYRRLWRRTQREFEWLPPHRTAEGFSREYYECLDALNERSLAVAGFLTTALVVRYDTCRPGKGFFDFAFTGDLLQSGESESAFWADHLSIAHRYFTRSA